MYHLAVVPERAAVVTVVFFAVSVECNLAFVGFAAACEAAAKTYFAGLSCLVFAEPQNTLRFSVCSSPSLLTLLKSLKMAGRGFPRSRFIIKNINLR